MKRWRSCQPGRRRSYLLSTAGEILPRKAMGTKRRPSRRMFARPPELFASALFVKGTLFQIMECKERKITMKGPSNLSIALPETDHRRPVRPIVRKEDM